MSEHRNAPHRPVWGRSCWGSGDRNTFLSVPLCTGTHCQLWFVHICASLSPGTSQQHLRAPTLHRFPESPRNPSHSTEHPARPRGAQHTSLREFPPFVSPARLQEGRRGAKSHLLPAFTPSTTKPLQHSQQAPKGFLQGQKQRGEGRSRHQAESQVKLEGAYLPLPGPAEHREQLLCLFGAPQVEPGCSFDIPCNFPPAHT